MFRAARRHRLEAYLKRLYGYAYSLTNDPVRSEDLVHDTAVKALAARRVPRDEAAYRAWLFKILRNTLTDETRRGPPRDSQVEPSAIDGEPGWSHWSETQEVNAVTVRLAFSELPGNHREILAAIDVAGLTYAEAAELFDIPMGTVMSRISRARSALYKRVEETNTRGNIRVLPLRKRSATGR